MTVSNILSDGNTHIYIKIISIQNDIKKIKETIQGLCFRENSM